MLLAERGLKITKVSEDTGISRTTLTSLANNYSMGIQFDTINKLCLYLQVTPENFFSYLPFDYSISIGMENRETFTVEFTFTSKNKKQKGYLLAFVDAEYERILIDEDSGTVGKVATEFSVELVLQEENDDDTKKENEVMKKYLQQIPIIFKNNIEEQILEYIEDRINDIPYETNACAIDWEI